MNISELRESKYLTKADCDPELRVTINHLEKVNVALEGDPPEERWALHFKGDHKPMILNSTNGQLIAQSLGSEETDDWAGKEIVLYNDPSITFRGKLVGGIRVRARARKERHPNEDRSSVERQRMATKGYGSVAPRPEADEPY
jgi:hypothetical protein